VTQETYIFFLFHFILRHTHHYCLWSKTKTATLYWSKGMRLIVISFVFIICEPNRNFNLCYDTKM